MRGLLVCVCVPSRRNNKNGFREGLAMRLQTAPKTSIIAMEMLGIQTIALEVGA